MGELSFGRTSKHKVHLSNGRRIIKGQWRLIGDLKTSTRYENMPQIPHKSLPILKMFRFNLRYLLAEESFRINFKYSLWFIGTIKIIFCFLSTYLIYLTFIHFSQLFASQFVNLKNYFSNANHLENIFQFPFILVHLFHTISIHTLLLYFYFGWSGNWSCYDLILI